VFFVKYKVNVLKFLFDVKSTHKGSELYQLPRVKEIRVQ
jgi:hypothetical protein